MRKFSQDFDKAHAVGVISKLLPKLITLRDWAARHSDASANWSNSPLKIANYVLDLIYKAQRGEPLDPLMEDAVIGLSVYAPDALGIPYDLRLTAEEYGQLKDAMLGLSSRASVVANIKVAQKFERILNKRASILEEVAELISQMHNEGYADEEILGIVEETLMRSRPSMLENKFEHKTKNRDTEIEPLSRALTEHSAIAHKFNKILKNTSGVQK